MKSPGSLATTMDESNTHRTVEAVGRMESAKIIAKLARMLRDGDERGSEVKTHLSAMTHHREIGDWEAARHDAEQLVGWAVARADANEGRGSST